MPDLDRIAALKAELSEAQEAVAALRDGLLDLLIEMQQQLLRSPEGRAEIAAMLVAQAEHLHPVVAKVFREAAVRVRGPAL